MSEIKILVENFAIYGLGVIALSLLTVYLSSRVWHLGAKHAKNGEANMRSQDDGKKYSGKTWPESLIFHLGEMSSKIDQTNRFLSNGLNTKLADVAQAVSRNSKVIEKCHDRNKQKETKSPF